MPPRLRLAHKTTKPLSTAPLHPCQSHYATVAAITPASPTAQTIYSISPIAHYPSTQPPSHKPPQFRKSQLHRQYASLLRSTPLMLLFQHNNLRSNEWMAIRRELARALRKVDEQQAAAAEGRQHTNPSIADGMRLQIIQTGIFAAALRVVEYFHPESNPGRLSSAAVQQATDATSPTPAQSPNTTPSPSDRGFTHLLSRTAYRIGTNKRHEHPLEPLLTGPLALLSFPTVSPAHLAATLSILASSPEFPAPRRKANPSYHDPSVQAGLSKLLLLGARVEGRVFDAEGTRWVGGIEGGLEGLRAQLVGMLMRVGAGLTGTLEGVGRTLYITMEGRRGMLDDAGKGTAAEVIKEA